MSCKHILILFLVYFQNGEKTKLHEVKILVLWFIIFRAMTSISSRIAKSPSNQPSWITITNLSTGNSFVNWRGSPKENYYSCLLLWFYRFFGYIHWPQSMLLKHLKLKGGYISKAKLKGQYHERPFKFLRKIEKKKG